MWVAVNTSPWPLHARERDPVPFAKEAAWAAGQVWTGEENLAFTGIRSPNRPARSESLYRLSYSGPLKKHFTWWIRLYSACPANKIFISQWGISVLKSKSHHKVRRILSRDTVRIFCKAPDTPTSFSSVPVSGSGPWNLLGWLWYFVLFQGKDAYENTPHRFAFKVRHT